MQPIFFFQQVQQYGVVYVQAAVAEKAQEWKEIKPTS
jgi:hypothetical protein